MDRHERPNLFLSSRARHAAAPDSPLTRHQWAERHTGCRSCGLPVANASHGTDGECIEALHAAIQQLRVTSA